MSTYSTGELAKLCKISVRTVQFYDSIDLLKPAELTDGGRRLYSEQDLSQMLMICYFRNLGLTLNSIKEILQSEHPEKVFLKVLDEQEKKIDADLALLSGQKQSLSIVRDTIVRGIPLNKSVFDIEKTMINRQGLNKLHIIMLILATPATLIEWSTAIFWYQTGIWWPFAVAMILALLLGYFVARMYYRQTEYVCPECGKQFKPSFWKMVFANHTPKTRKLTCSHCGNTGYCVEVFAGKS